MSATEAPCITSADFRKFRQAVRSTTSFTYKANVHLGWFSGRLCKLLSDCREPLASFDKDSLIKMLNTDDLRGPEIEKTVFRNMLLDYSKRLTRQAEQDNEGSWNGWDDDDKAVAVLKTVFETAIRSLTAASTGPKLPQGECNPSRSDLRDGQRSLETRTSPGRS